MSKNNGTKPLTVARILANALVAAKGAVAQAALENRGALELALADAERGGIREWQRQAEDLQEILAALDEWHTATMAITTKPVLPAGWESSKKEEIN